MVEQEVVDCLNDIIIIVEKKEKKRLYDKEYRRIYREKNKEKIKESNKKYRDNNKEKIKESNNKWRENNEDKIKEYNNKNRDKKRLYDKKYDEENKEKKRLYRQTEKGIKSRRIARWKHSGVICDDWNEIYNHYLRTSYCDICKVELTYDKLSTPTTKCLDHCHVSGQVRNILCHSCNRKRGQNNF